MRYIIGIDLGTTNSSLSYVDLDRSVNPTLSVKTFLIPQLGRGASQQDLPYLPSCCYIFDRSAQVKYKLPWGSPKDHIVGKLAYEEGIKVPVRLVQSAKSWLCHDHASRKLAILPSEASQEIERISPVEAASRILSHFLKAWNFAIAKGDAEKEFEAQEVILTVPASFDEVARSLTVEAAKEVGFGSLTLLEEPQAAFYHWMADKEDSLSKFICAGNIILIVDVGGGTADFSLIEASSKEGQLNFNRISVGDHLLLGGDNMDEALAHHIEKKLQRSQELTMNEWLSLRLSARAVKEALLAEDAPDFYRITVQGKGSTVVKGTEVLEIAKSEVRDLLVDGFFGRYAWDEASLLKRKSGLRPMGLPYEDEPSITKQIASFLKKCGKRPDYVLFNGGTMKPKLFREEVLNSLRSWFDNPKIEELCSESLELAVAKGAAHFGKVRKGLAKRIGGGAARSYYTEVECHGKPMALTLLERGAEEGTVVRSTEIFLLLANKPVSFKVYTSQTRLHDRQGEIHTIDPLEMHLLPALHTVLRFGKSQEKIPARLEARLTEIGILELALLSVNTEHRFLLEFQTRDSSLKENASCLFGKGKLPDETVGLDELKPARERIASFFNSPYKEGLIEDLEKLLEKGKVHWPLSFLRSLFDEVIKHAAMRKKSPKHEERFWNLCGFLLRPGQGFALDGFRIKELWKVILADFSDKNISSVQIQKWICFRRIALGLNKGQQARIATNLLEGMPHKGGRLLRFKNSQEAYFYSEKVRALASLEWLEASLKISLGNALLQRIASKEAQACDFYALGRIGARNLFYAAFTQTVSSETVQEWLEKLLLIENLDEENLESLCIRLAALSPHRELNISRQVTEKILKRLAESDGFQRLHEFIVEGSSLTFKEQEELLADQLPIGLILNRSS